MLEDLGGFGREGAGVDEGDAVGVGCGGRAGGGPGYGAAGGR